MRAVPLLVGLAAVFAAAAGPLAASEPLPAGTVPSTGAPPLVSEAEGDALPEWVAACIAAGRRQVGTRAGGDLLYSAGVVLAQELAQPSRALDVLGEAASAYPVDAPYRSLVLLTAAELHLAAGDAVAARRMLDSAESATGRPAPVDADAVTLARRALANERLATLGSGLGVRIDEATGDLDSAAERQERIAARLDRAGDSAAVRAWEVAARIRARAGNRARALAAVDRALELVERDAVRANLSFWRLHLQYGLLDADGAPALGTSWPGDAFVEDARATLRGLHGNPRVGPWLLALASQAVTSDRDDVALDLYLLALRDPVLVDRARDDPDVSGGLLVAFPVALRLGRLDDAGRILDAVAGIADLLPKDLDALRLALARARDEAMRTAAPAPPPAQAPKERETEAAPSPHRGRLYPHGPPGEEEDGGEVAAGQPSEDGGDAGPSSGRRWLLGAVSGLAGLAVFAILARRRRRRCASLGGHPPRR